jgi:tetratricopeptide (TPR) repeat protein
MRELLAETDKHFHADGRWQEQNISALAEACEKCALTEQAAAWLDEAISAHQRSHPRGAGRDQQLSGYYQRLALARSTLGQTKAAVDAALAGVVSSSDDHSRQSESRATLDRVLNNAKDLDVFVHAWDEEATKSGQDSPLLRQAIGSVFKKREQFEPAVAQLQLAARLQPNDRETRKTLIECYDSTGQTQHVIDQLLALAAIDPRDPEPYERLMGRLSNAAKSDAAANHAEQAGKFTAEAERAATSIVEQAPGEAEAHARLARIRETASRWDEAITQWEQVARLRALEPTGLLGLANAQIQAKRTTAAQETIKKLRATTWPERFKDVAAAIKALEEKLSQ